MGGRARGALPRRYHVLALSTLAGIATLLAMRPGTHRGRSSAQARAGAILGLLVYLVLPLAAAMPRPGRGGAVDRTPGIVLARYRQAQADVAADDRPVATAVDAGAPARVHAGRSGARSHRLLDAWTSETRLASRPTPADVSAESARLPSVPPPAIGRRLNPVRPPAKRRWPAGFAVDRWRSG